MSEQSKNENEEISQLSEAELHALIKKMYQHIISIEKKLDSFMSRPPEKSPYAKPAYDKSYSKPFRSFPRPVYRSGGDSESRYRGDDARERSFPPKRNYEKRSEGEGRGFSGNRKTYGGDREGNFEDRPFKKKFDDKKGSFGPRKKPFFSKRRD